jgi:hypothetical protein
VKVFPDWIERWVTSGWVFRSVSPGQSVVLWNDMENFMSAWMSEMSSNLLHEFLVGKLGNQQHVFWCSRGIDAVPLLCVVQKQATKNRLVEKCYVLVHNNLSHLWKCSFAVAVGYLLGVAGGCSSVIQSLEVLPTVLHSHLETGCSHTFVIPWAACPTDR